MLRAAGLLALAVAGTANDSRRLQVRASTAQKAPSRSAGTLGRNGALRGSGGGGMRRACLSRPPARYQCPPIDTREIWGRARAGTSAPLAQPDLPPSQPHCAGELVRRSGRERRGECHGPARPLGRLRQLRRRRHELRRRDQRHGPARPLGCLRPEQLHAGRRRLRLPDGGRHPDNSQRRRRVGVGRRLHPPGRRPPPGRRCARAPLLQHLRKAPVDH